MARKTVDAPHAVASLGEAGEAVAEMAAIDRKLRLIELRLSEKIEEAKACAAKEAAGLAERFGELERAVCLFATPRRDELFKEGKTLDLGAGKIGFRLSKPSIVQERGVTVEASLARLRELGFAEGIAVKETLAKSVLLGWPEERLKMAGLVKRQTEDFFVDIARASAPQGA